ncbi:hypothetical protein CQA66_08950 [Helicobacter aurati]|uniref:LicD/FKTN/FKRP nucleotidyltransferase domain-containing protein n=1 Tax=Helicobacter aurati TaxID=137778 RepID=A0A3D8IXU2_9HELI|nr:LicD family protein [Helicobacter aurati]RDU69371.1 hypothetical protein CQA66_08950 [Helicobacter aurati]
MTEQQNGILTIAKDFKRICETYNLRYSLAFGTFLGAVRHKGFIPWDDDMDFFMPRQDYDRLIDLFQDSERKGITLFSNPSYKLRFFDSLDWMFPWGCIEDTSTTFIINTANTGGGGLPRYSRNMD